MNSDIKYAGLLALALVAGAAAQDYPAKPVRLVVPTEPAGGLDIMARAISTPLSQMWGHPVIVDNRPGAGILVGSETASKAPADGYTLLIVNANLAPNLILRNKLDVAQRLTGVAKIADLPTALAVAPGFSAKSVGELITLAKSSRLTYSSTGIGTIGNICGEMLKLAAKVDITHVPYKGGSPAMTAIMGGQVTMGFASLASALAQVSTGKLRILAIASEKRSRLAPDIPAINETLPGVVLDTWVGLVAPAGTPAPIVRKVNADALKIVAAPDISQRMLNLGYDLQPGAPEIMDRLIRSDIEKYTKVIREANIRNE